MGSSPLFPLIAELIRGSGPIGLDRYMALCLGHPEHGYYRSRDPFGAKGDFTTAPEISQMFGELLGLWAATVWNMAGHGEPMRLVELGPGRGTLTADACRAIATALPGLPVEVDLVETSPVLRRLQRERLTNLRPVPRWHEEIDAIPPGPTILLANEFFDALPVRQFERTPLGWCERLIGLSANGAQLAWGLSPEPDSRIVQDAPAGVVMSVPGAGLEIVRGLSRRIATEGGALLLIDYGHARPGFGDTLQAVKGHAFADPLSDPGEADLTVHVDFPALACAAQAEGVRVYGPVDQRDLLLGLGLRQRADRLKRDARPDQVQAIESTFARLTDRSRRGMGGLFKALCLAHPSLADVPGFPGTN